MAAKKPATAIKRRATKSAGTAPNPAVHPPAILLMGPTASGKTGVAVELVRQLNCEIISVDSAQVYRDMDIGTAKPDADILAAAPHHLINLISPDETYSAARFRDDALTLMREITERGNIPLLVGGTMMYFKTLTEGLSELPEADPLIRMIIDTMAEEKGWPGVHRELARVDPEIAARLAPNDAQRIQRALEVYYITDRTMSELQKKPKYVYFPYTPLKIALLPSDRAALHERIADRFEGMLELGLISELRKLRKSYALEATMPSMRCVGYRQAWQGLDEGWRETEIRERGIFATRQLAKRQLTWLRGMPQRTVVVADAPQALSLTVQAGLRALQASR
jgi:tRNA dimethylallyltransferase